MSREAQMIATHSNIHYHIYHDTTPYLHLTEHFDSVIARDAITLQQLGVTRANCLLDHNDHICAVTGICTRPYLFTLLAR